MYEFFEDPRRVLKLSHVLLAGGLAMLIAGIFLAYFFDALLTLPALVCAHGMTILGPTAIKAGYVMRLLAHNRMRHDQVAQEHA